MAVAPGAALALPPSGSQAAEPPGAPVVLVPGYTLNRVLVTVHNQTVAPECPRSGSFEDTFANPAPSTEFSQECRDKLMTLRVSKDTSRPWSKRFHFQAGVNMTLPDYGKTSSAPFYEPLYARLEQAGYTRDKDIRVADYNPRLTPDLDGFLTRTVRLIEDTYRDNGHRPVHLVGHSNGPIYAQYLLTHTSRAWKHRYIHGFTPLAGNFPGQGSLYAIMFIGLNTQDFSFPASAEQAATSARMYRSQPATYLSAADPDVFGDREVVLRDESTGTDYTPADVSRLINDAHLNAYRSLAQRYIGFVKFTDPADFPDVDVYAEKGSGLDTVVGAALPDLTLGQPLAPTATLFTQPGDSNQEEITNDAVAVWSGMRCFRFSLTDNPGVGHFDLPGDPGVLDRLVAHLQEPRSNCF
jgi:lysophospholipase-3